MKDSQILRMLAQRDVANHNVTITENRAPTDESIRLLNEFQKKAMDNIVAQVKVGENYLKGVIIGWEDRMDLYKIRFIVKFNLNGRDYTLEGDIDRDERLRLGSAYLGSSGLYRFLHEKFASLVATEIMKGMPDFRNTINGL